MVLDGNYQFRYVNDWLLKRCPALTNRQHASFTDVFPELRLSRVEEGVHHALSEGMPSVISHVFSKSPFPIYKFIDTLGKSIQLSEQRIVQSIRITPMVLEQHETGCLISIDDISFSAQRETVLSQQMVDRKEAEMALMQEQELFVAGPCVIFKLRNTSDFSVVYVSPNAKEQFSYDVAGLVNEPSFLDLIYPDDREQYIHDIALHVKNNNQHFELSYRIKHVNDGFRWVNDYVSTICNSQGEIEFFHGYLVDVSVQKETEQLIRKQAYYDPLTKLPNRRMLMEHLSKDLSRSRRNNFFSALAFFDLDKFKYINDSLGHIVGDKLLVEVARRVQTHIRSVDTVARLGGDEFVVLSSGLSNEYTLAGERAGLLFEKIRITLNETYIIDGYELHTSPSVGIYIYHGNGNESSNEVIQHADTAMYKAKEAGRNTIRFYTEKMQHVANQRIELEKNLRLAIEKNEIHVLFQPQINQQNELLACEALVRWEKNGKIISPVDFIPLAEETGIIIDIGEWVLREACRCFKLWQKEHHNGDDLAMKHIAVNVSPRQFRDKNFLSLVQEALQAYDMRPHELEIEITEGIVIANVEETIDKMSQLQSMGVRIAMDDFGTGYSSLIYLKKLPLDILKIDQSFIRDADTNIHDKTIVSTIIAMAKQLGMDTVAEGIENAQILRFLEDEGCTIYQGYFFSKPIASDAFSDFISDWPKAEKGVKP